MDNLRCPFIQHFLRGVFNDNDKNNSVIVIALSSKEDPREIIIIIIMENAVRFYSSVVTFCFGLCNPITAFVASSKQVQCCM